LFIFRNFTRFNIIQETVSVEWRIRCPAKIIPRNTSCDLLFSVWKSLINSQWLAITLNVFTEPVNEPTKIPSKCGSGTRLYTVVTVQGSRLHDTHSPEEAVAGRRRPSSCVSEGTAGREASLSVFTLSKVRKRIGASPTNLRLVDPGSNIPSGCTVAWSQASGHNTQLTKNPNQCSA